MRCVLTLREAAAYGPQSREGLTRLDPDVFRDCRSLKNALLGDGLEEIGSGCFSRSGLEEIAVPSSVRSIGRDAFRSCASLRQITFSEDSLDEDGMSGLAARCPSLEIRESAFAGCST